MEEKNSRENNAEKIQSLREMIYAAEKTLQGAKSMLLQLEGKKKVGRRRKTSLGDESEGKIIEGTFDGQIMIGTDGKQYPVPANYASKSKLVEGDILKLTITPDGSFIYKQIGPVERRRVIGSVNQDGEGNYFVLAENKPFRVLLASITYFKVEPGDEVTLIIPKEIESDWGAIENVLLSARQKKTKIEEPLELETEEPQEAGEAEENISTTEEEKLQKKNKSILEEWSPNLEELKKELKEE
jgi:hypothetical protein